VLPTDQQPKLRAGFMLLDKYYTRVPEACIPSSDWFEYLQCINLLIISRCGWRGCISWLVLSAFKNV